MNLDTSATKSGLVGRYLTVLDLKTSCLVMSASVRWTKTICRGCHVSQPMRNCHESHVNMPLSNMAKIDSAPRLNAVCRDKKSACARQTDVPTNFNSIWPRQQKNCSSTTKNRLVCGSLYVITIGNLILAFWLPRCERVSLREDRAVINRIVKPGKNQPFTYQLDYLFNLKP